ncbi:unnamed protein product [Rangifer tarandus platyrhynchus]|uniref:Uncharacterized protein n=1 Tax=Rangifer tarandus platyrhynchus TaxID=3082113 RepID=A0ABN8Y507_RANTA|nr:unnamed protein product [Rangifer tarandus platyrhynchus]
MQTVLQSETHSQGPSNVSSVHCVRSEPLRAYPPRGPAGAGAHGDGLTRGRRRRCSHPGLQGVPLFPRGLSILHSRSTPSREDSWCDPKFLPYFLAPGTTHHRP